MLKTQQLYSYRLSDNNSHQPQTNSPEMVKHQTKFNYKTKPMKTLKYLLLTILGISILILANWDLVKSNQKKPLNTHSSETEVKSSVTFIMGTDELNSNNFYKNATYYFHMHPTDKTDVVIHTCKTMKDVLEYLRNVSENQYFTTINIVCHGNPWQGLSMPIDTGLARSSFPNLQKALNNKWITPLCINAVDHYSKINIISCGVGQSKEISEILKKIFSCPKSESVPSINIEKNYINFTDNMDKKQSEFYFVASKYDYSDVSIIASKLKNKYKNVSINWNKAYKNELRNSTQEPYKHGFRMLVDWKIGFNDADEIPDLKKDMDIINWLKTQKEAMKELQQMQLKPEDFMWQCLMVTDQTNTIKIKGYGNVEGVMIDLKEDVNSPSQAILY